MKDCLYSIRMKICYTGVGSRKNGQHSEKQFLSAMKQYKKDCAVFIKSLTCKACQKIKVKNSNVHKNLDKHLKMMMPLFEKCRKCKNKTRKQCSVKEYIDFSGALVGNCKNVINKKVNV